MRYRIEYAPDAESHLRALTARQRAIVVEGADARLGHEPTRETRNRKRMRSNPLASWELRIGNLRVYYDVIVDPEPTIQILAVGIKERNQVRMGGRVVEL